MFRIDEIGYNFIHKNGIYCDRPHGSGNYLFVYFRTPVRLRIGNGEPMDVREPSFVLFRKKTAQYYIDMEKPFINDWMHFSGNGVEAFMEKLGIPLDTLLTIQNGMEISGMFQDLCREFWQDGPHHGMIMDAKVRCLFYKFSDSYYAQNVFSDKRNRYRCVFNQIRNDIYDHGTPEKTVVELAGNANLSTSYFQHIYKYLFGVPVSHDIIKSRVEYAGYLLQNNQDSVGEIAFQCGYENKEHFTRQFKKITGYTPREFRERQNKAG